MSDNVIDFVAPRRTRDTETARISKGLRKASRQCRREILNSHGYHVFWLGQATREQYVALLRAHYEIRRSIESQFDSLSGAFVVKNLATDEEKTFTVKKYVTTKRSKSSLIAQDLRDLGVDLSSEMALPPKAAQLIDYMSKVRNVYSAGLLGVLYMLEETVTYAGPIIARNLDRELGLHGKGTSYLRGGTAAKVDLWEFRKSLDLITDLQTQVNVVTAAAITYQMYRDLLDARASYTPRRPAKLN